jgi:hypothetical protein
VAAASPPRRRPAVPVAFAGVSWTGCVVSTDTVLRWRWEEVTGSFRDPSSRPPPPPLSAGIPKSDTAGSRTTCPGSARRLERGDQVPEIVSRAAGSADPSKRLALPKARHGITNNAKIKAIGEDMRKICLLVLALSLMALLGNPPSASAFCGECRLDPDCDSLCGPSGGFCTLEQGFPQACGYCTCW